MPCLCKANQGPCVLGLWIAMVAGGGTAGHVLPGTWLGGVGSTFSTLYMTCSALPVNGAQPASKRYSSTPAANTSTLWLMSSRMYCSGAM